ncbi:ubiquitin-protein ligase [Sporothrix brasiliensis 5110]|uniref:Ubiquitin-protein ligase n=1 Tax=Sporothrix brasiliensis 5110 TaxID=1398154 RepID=A0A0C2J1X4_9PEZI|nr:ubiquitin-protein ligase [Sporothrix brasiliensis 5110]KIH93005.1 ubiquitin-protein ligase [Sporothrix brasiliensis 5110]
MAEDLVPSAGMPFDNASAWHNFTVWTAQHLAFLNMTRITPSFDNLVWAGPRMVKKLGRLGSYIPFPDGIDGFAGFGGLGGIGQRVIPGATDAAGNILYGATGVPASDAFATAAAAAGAAAGATAAAEQDFAATLAASASRFSLESARGLGSLFSYATSKWALCCIATAVILNRTYIFAATRRRIRLRWPIRLLLRSLPIALFLVQGHLLLQSIQCQTSPDFAELRWNNASKQSDLMFSEASVFLHGLSSTLLLNPTDADSCRAIRMVPVDRYAPTSNLRGSLSLLWPLFITFCLSSFVETLSCAIQGRPVAAETGMTVFEHSLAFAEADAAISNQLGWGTFAAATGSSASASASSNKSATLAAVLAAATQAAVGGSNSVGGTAIAMSRSAILSRVNTPPEVLLLAFLSAMSHVTSHILGVLNLQAKFRLISTGFWALCFMASIVWSALNFSLDDPAAQSLLRFPTVSIVGFIPHMLVLAGIIICFFIYGIALLLCAVSQEPDIFFGSGAERVTFRERIAQAHSNMQANLPMGNVRISMEMDFYTALLRAGFDAITMASEAVYLNEDRRVSLRSHTWLEDERYNELQELRSRWLGSDLPGSRFDALGATGLVPISGNKSGPYSTGYSRERAIQKNSAAGKQGERIRPIRTGIGASERSGRWLMAVEYLAHVGKLMMTFTAVYMHRLLSWAGIRSQPRWLQRLVQRRKAGRSAGDRDGFLGGGDGQPSSDEDHSSEWFVAKTGSLPIQRRGQIDVEHEVRRRFAASQDLSKSSRQEEREIDNKLYLWWLKGGWWGEVDTSGDYEPSIAADDDDATSVISVFDMEGSESEWEDDETDGDNANVNRSDAAGSYSYEYDGSNSDIDNDGQRTPTQQSPWITRESTPMHDVSMEAPELARLLDPQSPEERAEAQALAAHLNSDGILTRSAFARFRQRQRAELLATSRYGIGASRLVSSFRPGARMTPDEEAQLLEQILLSRRAAMRPLAPLSDNRGVDDDGDMTLRGGGGEGEGGESSWANGAAGMGSDGPQCVVCQSSPRTIIVWPCRCLSLCDDCRVSLAMNNFDKCVCCRRDVVSFSRIFVP